MKHKKVRFDKSILSATPHNHQPPPDKNSFNQLRDIMQWFLFFPAVIALIFACAQLAIFTNPKVVYADKGSNLEAEYGPWSYLPIAAIREDILEAIRLDQDLGSTLIMLFERPESIVTSWVEDGKPARIASAPTQESSPLPATSQSTTVTIQTNTATNTPQSSATLSATATPQSLMTSTSPPTATATDLPATLIPTSTSAPSSMYVDVGIKSVNSSEGILPINQGSILIWVQFLEGADRGDHMIVHSNDSRLVLYVDTFFSGALDREILSIGARAGGNKVALYADGDHQGYPEARLLIDNDGYLREIDYAAGIPWIGIAQFPEGEWHHLAMTWSGYPTGIVKLYLDGILVSEMEYDSRFDDGRALYQMFSYGFKPYAWPTVDQLPEVDIAGSGSLDSGGILTNDLRIYPSNLSAAEILSIVSQGME